MRLRRIVFKLTFLAFAVAANCFGSALAGKIILPLYLDSILTMAATALCGLWGGIACAVLSNGILFLFDRTMIPFVICHICTAVLAHLTFRYHQKTADDDYFLLETFLWAGLWSALSNALFGNIISQAFFSSSTMQNVDNAAQGIFLATENLPFALYFAGTVTNLADKMISACLSFAAYWAGRKIIRLFDEWIITFL